MNFKRYSGRSTTLLLTSLAAIALATSPVQAQQQADFLTLPGGSAVVVQATPMTYALPGYGTVTVAWTAASGSGMPAMFSSAQVPLDNRVIPGATGLELGANMRLMMFDSGGNGNNYTVTFTFNNGPPDLSQLQLLVFNLGYIPATGKTKVTPSPAMTLGGNYNATAFPIPVTMTGSVIESSAGTGGAASNTGIANFRVTNPSTPLPIIGGKPTLSLAVSQIGNDQIAFGLAMRRVAKLKLCKVAGDGVPVGSMVNFNIAAGGANQTFGVPAGPAPGGFCRMVPASFPEGTGIRIVEQVPSGQVVSNIEAVSPIALDQAVGSINRQAGSIEMRLVGLSEVTYTNRREIKEGEVGYIEICKSGGSQQTATFSVTGATTSASTPVGSCTAPIRIAVPGDGKVVISETGPAQPFGCSTYPNDRLIGYDPATGNCTVTAVRGGVAQQTVVNFVNR